jgi:23S rRNA pseudouridine1911/1915/1917 synthase
MSQTKSLTVKSGNVRLDQFLATVDGIKSRNAAQKIVEGGSVRVNGKKVTKHSFQVQLGDKIEYALPEAAAIPKKRKKATPLPVLYEDSACMVIQKPAGLTVHPGTGTKPGEETVLSALEPLFAEREIPFSESEVLVHRLDKDTTGCMLIAKTPKAHMALQEQFASRSVEKTYLAVVAGIPAQKAAVIDAPIGRHGTERTRMSVHQATASRNAKTTYKTLDTNPDENVALLECDLHTGRTHQIRVHLSAIGHPILGDDTYGSTMSKDITKSLKIDSVCLHAWKLSFDSVGKKKTRIEVEAPLSKKMASALKKMELEIDG